MPYTMETREDPKVSLAADMLRDCGRVQLQAWGTSMLPSLWPGDLLTIESVAHDEVVLGDIVLILRDHAFLIHRLVERRQDQGRITWITKGDAVPRNDPTAGASQLLGRVTGIQHGIRLLVPSRRVSLLRSVLAWALCHSNRFRNLTLRVHATRAQAGVRGVAGISPSYTSHP